MFCRSLCYKDYAVLEANAKVNKKPNSSTFICLSIRNFVAATGYSFCVLDGHVIFAPHYVGQIPDPQVKAWICYYVILTCAQMQTQ